MALEEMIILSHDTQQICLSMFTRNFYRLPFEAFYLSSFPDFLSISHGHSSELKNIHPHRSLGRSGRRHSTAGGRDVSRQYVSHFDRNTDCGHQTSTQRRLRGEYRQDDPTGIRPTRVLSCTTIEFMTFWSHDWRCVERCPSS